MPILFLDYKFQNSFSLWQQDYIYLQIEFIKVNHLRQQRNAAAKMVNPRPTSSVQDQMTVPTGMTDPYDIDGHS